MRVALSTGWFFPERTGGTEVYVDSLADELTRLGYGVEIGTATTAFASGYSNFAGRRVYRWNVANENDWRVIRGVQPPQSLEVFRSWLQEGNFHIYHQHSWTMGCWAHELKAARQLGLRCFLTIHLPDRIFTCGRHMERVRVARRFENFSEFRALTPEYLSCIAYRSIPGKLGTLLGLVGREIILWQALAEAAELCEKVIVVSRWLREALVLNKYPQEKLVVSRQGIETGSVPSCTDRLERISLNSCIKEPEKNFAKNRPITIGYLGRFTPIKGVDLLCEAIARLPARIDVRLVLAGPQPVDSLDCKYYHRVKNYIALDSRISLHGPVQRGDLGSFFTQIDLLAVPSRCLETGPLVIMESLAFGVPFLGSDRGGIRECWEDFPGCGLLVPPDNVEAWVNVIKKLYETPDALKKLRDAAIQSKPRSMRDVAQEMATLYNSLK